MLSETPTKISYIVILGESGVGKTCFTDMFLLGTHFGPYDPTDVRAPRKQMLVDGKQHQLHVDDLNSSLLHGPQDSIDQSPLQAALVHRACGIVLLYDITCLKSFEDLTMNGYWYVRTTRNQRLEHGREGGCYPCGGQRFGCVLVGTKKDLAGDIDGKREVDADLAREWAESQGIQFFEVDKWGREEIEETMRELVRDVVRTEARDLQDMEEQGARLKEKASKGNPGIFPMLRNAWRQILPKSR